MQRLHGASTVAVALLIAALSACNGVINEPATTSELTFTYDGHRTGTFSASGEAPSAESTYIWDHTWALGRRFSEAGQQWVLVSANLRAGSASHIIQMTVPEGQRGMFELAGEVEDVLIFD